MKIGLTVLMLALFALGCAGVQPPTQELADAEAASRSALELGAQSNPQAQLHLKLAAEQIEEAKAAMEEDEHERAASLLARAQADAELAVALSREASAKQQVQQAAEQTNVQRTTTGAQGGRR